MTIIKPNVKINLLIFIEMSERILALIQVESSKKVMDHSNISSLLSQNFKDRMNWIQYLDPDTRVEEVLETYQCFKHPQHVSQ